MLSIMVDAKERCDMATADVEGAYLHFDRVDFTLVRLEGQAVYIMCKVCKSYKALVVYEGGKNVLYLE